MSLLDLATDVKPHLTISGSTDDTKLQAKLDSAEAFVARRTSAGSILAAEAITERVDGNRTDLMLTKLPVVSVTSVVGANGDALTVASLDVNEQQGIIRYTPIASIIFPMPWYTVVYQAGYANRAALPDDLVEAVRLMTQYFWATQRGPTARPGTGAESGGGAADAYARAMQILDNGLTVAGFA